MPRSLLVQSERPLILHLTGPKYPQKRACRVSTKYLYTHGIYIYIYIYVNISGKRIMALGSYLLFGYLDL